MILIFLSLSAGGCAFNPDIARRGTTPFLNQAENYYIPHVPFIKQRKNFCGPAATASILNYWGQPVSQDDIAAGLYEPSAGGTLNIDIADYIINRGLWAQEYNKDFDGLKPYIRKNIPVIMLQELGFAPIVKHHYVVLIGYDDLKKEAVVHSSNTHDNKITYRALKTTWKRAGNWALIAAPVEDVDWELSPEEHIKLGNLCERLNRLDIAIIHYREAINKLPDDPAGYFNSGNIYLKKGDYEEAARYYKKAIDLAPSNGDFYNNLACAELELGKFNEAERDADKALLLNPKRRACYLDTKGMLYFKRGLYADAFAILKDARSFAGSDKDTIDMIDKHIRLTEEKRLSEGK